MPYQVIEIGNQIKVVSTDGTTTASAPGPAGDMIQKNFETISVMFNGVHATTTVLNTKIEDVEDRVDSIEDDIEDHELRITDLESILIEDSKGAIITVVQTISAGTSININSGSTKYTRVGSTDLSLGSTQAEFRENEKVIIMLNGVIQDKYVNITWLSNITLAFNDQLDINDRIQISNL